MGKFSPKWSSYITPPTDKHAHEIYPDRFSQYNMKQCSILYTVACIIRYMHTLVKQILHKIKERKNRKSEMYLIHTNSSMPNHFTEYKVQSKFQQHKKQSFN